MTSRLFSLTSAVLMGTAVLPMTAQADLSGNAGVVSQYILRGITNTPEDSNAAIQGGIDWSNDNGLYAGYWGSNLGYNSTPKYSAQGFENDFYAGYSGMVGDVSLQAGLIQYYYVNVTDSDGTEFAGSVGIGPLSLGVISLLQDVAWGNQGDTYVTLGFDQPLPMNFTAGATAGYYFYSDNGKYIASSAESSAFRHLNLSLSHPIGNTGADVTLTYIVGGKDRNGTSQDNAMTLGVAYGFDIK